ncbi:hypothetical protein [Pseudomonas schmalbachii]|uniref:Uncharacterized protein n=1 Tax=Pseudomonas schmalbachii TaxID=2816993 RepID=A0ABS3TWT9_9PSED|nr:hypothetical protein [Pseudomonas schmalbachii]MBO3278118.1 hypothetical protein [Pseudomonas schmalbachii]
MAFSLIPDPLKMCRDALTKIENGVNTLAARKLESGDFALAISGITKVTHGVQYISEKSLETIFKRLDMPSRQEVTALAAAVQRVEDKLDQLLPAPEKAALIPRPARTRRPAPVEEAAAPAKPAAKPKAKKAAAKPKAKAAAPAQEAKKEEVSDVIAP